MRPKILIVFSVLLLFGGMYMVIQDIHRDLATEASKPMFATFTTVRTPPTSVAGKMNDLSFPEPFEEDYCHQPDCSTPTSVPDYSEPFPNGMPPGPLSEQQKHGYCEYYPTDSRCIGYDPYVPVTTTWLSD